MEMIICAVTLKKGINGGQFYKSMKMTLFNGVCCIQSYMDDFAVCTYTYVSHYTLNLVYSY